MASNESETENEGPQNVKEDTAALCDVLHERELHHRQKSSGVEGGDNTGWETRC
jgi:hypothetical protein